MTTEESWVHKKIRAETSPISFAGFAELIVTPDTAHPGSYVAGDCGLAIPVVSTVSGPVCHKCYSTDCLHARAVLAWRAEHDMS